MKTHSNLGFIARLGQAGLLAGLLLASVAVPGQTLAEAMREQVLMVKKGEGFTSVELETTLYRPPGPGPFPVIIINHGKAPGNPAFQERARYEVAAREFLQRNYMVVVPMRQGFSKSSGSYIGGGCNVESNGRVQAEDVSATLSFLKTLPEADLTRIVIVGQSHGGLTTMAFGTVNHPGVQGLINFAGGLRQDNCTAWEFTLIRAFGAYARETRLPSLWFYGDNDSYWQPWLYREMHQSYVNAGGQARLVAYGNFGSDAHGLFSSRSGTPIWLPQVEKFLAELDLPHQVVHKIPVAVHELPVPASTGFAAGNDEKALPHVKQGGRDGYLKYMSSDAPKAFAISQTGAWAFSTARPDAMKRALDRCNQTAKDGKCRLYAVDDEVVWVKE